MAAIVLAVTNDFFGSRLLCRSCRVEGCCLFTGRLPIRRAIAQNTRHLYRYPQWDSNPHLKRF